MGRFRTQGSASLHPWATIQCRFAAQRLSVNSIYRGVDAGDDTPPQSDAPFRSCRETVVIRAE